MLLVERERGIVAPAGFLATGVVCGIKPTSQPDLTLIHSEVPAIAAGTFTSNRLCAAPVRLSRERIVSGRGQCIVANSGNANACTGETGARDARRMGQIAAEVLGLEESLVYVASTGKIGVPLPMEKVEAGIRAAARQLGRGEEAAEAAARGIMTTDTVPKQIAVSVEAAGTEVTIGGICKGAGMICPKHELAGGHHAPHATMLCFITTDAAIELDALQHALWHAVDDSFNRVTVDGDTSTNDTCIILANGRAGNLTIADGGPGFRRFSEVLAHVTTYLAKAIARDGEGATKLVEITVTGAADTARAHIIAKAIANSPLVKTAFYGGDPNWGRIMAAAGACGVELVPEQVAVWLGDAQVVERGGRATYDQAVAADAVRGLEITVRVRVGDGAGSCTVWTCDLTHGYIDENRA